MPPPDRLVTVSAYGAAGSSARVRIFDWLRRTGLAAERHTYLGRADNPLSAIVRDPAAVIAAERDLRLLAGRVDDATVLLSREASPVSLGGIESRLLRGASRGIYDFDDALYAGYPGGLVARARHIDWVWRRSVRAADTVIAGNERLAEHAARLARDVVVIPSCVELDGYVEKTSYAVPETPTAVWLGSPSTESQLDVAASALLRLHRELGLRLTLISAGARSHGELDAMIDRVAWAPEGFGAALADADVGIMPLVDDEWTRGKCGYKLLQYGAAALPVVGSAVGVNVQVLDRLGGAAVRTEDEWRDALHEVLVAGETRRAELGRRAREGVAAHYSFNAWADCWRQVIDG